MVQISFAEWLNPQIKYSNIYHHDIRDSAKHFYGQRLATFFSYRDTEDRDVIIISPFFEIRRNIDRDLWERREAGIELGTDLFNWLYVGQTIQATRYKEDFKHYEKIDKGNYTETVIKLCASYDLLKNDNIHSIGFIANDYTFNIDKGKALRNEVSFGLKSPFFEFLETSINWRHIDRVHYFDSDTFEITASLVF